MFLADDLAILHRRHLGGRHGELASPEPLCKPRWGLGNRCHKVVVDVLPSATDTSLRQWHDHVAAIAPCIDILRQPARRGSEALLIVKPDVSATTEPCALRPSWELPFLFRHNRLKCPASILNNFSSHGIDFKIEIKHNYSGRLTSWHPYERVGEPLPPGADLLLVGSCILEAVHSERTLPGSIGLLRVRLRITRKHRVATLRVVECVFQCLCHYSIAPDLGVTMKQSLDGKFTRAQR